jgi:exoribonuclease-2
MGSAGARLAVVAGLRNNRVDLRVGWEAKAMQVPPRELVLLRSLPVAFPPGDVPQRLEQPPWRLNESALAAAKPNRRELGSAWLLLGEASGSAPPDLTGLVDLVGDGADPAQLAACWLWLEGEQTLFRFRNQRIEARPLADLRSLRHGRHQLRLQEQQRQHWRQTLRQRQPIHANDLAPSEQADLRALRRWASSDTTVPLGAELLKLLHDCHCPAEPGPIRHLLADLGQWERHHLPGLEATTWQLGFDEALLREADQLVERAEEAWPGDEQRRDLMAQWVVTIDDPDTRDIDDGLGLEWLADGRARLWIHIADPGRLVAPDSPLDLEARRRASSLYLAQGNLPMFPPKLAHGPMSLRSGVRSAAWSLWVDLDSEGSVLADGLERSWIRPTYRLSYADADELIELAPPQERDLLTIHTLLEGRHQWRRQRGALLLDDPEGRIRCRPDSVSSGLAAEVEVVEPSPARRMVAEAMVLAGALVAERGEREGLALPFRSQAPCELPPSSELEELPPGVVRHAAIKRCLGRGLVGTKAAPHFSLGLTAYVQATSPIRRYGDLVVQRQWQAFQEGSPALAEEELALLLQELEAPLRQGLQISREDQRHWLQVWFEQQQRQRWPGVFLRWLRVDQQLGLVWLDDLCQTLPCHCPSRSEPGKALLVEVLEVDSLRDTLRLEAAS